MNTKGLSGAEAFLRVLGRMGVERIFASPGSEWSPVWEYRRRGGAVASAVSRAGAIDESRCARRRAPASAPAVLGLSRRRRGRW